MKTKIERLVVQPHDGTFEGDNTFWAGRDCIPYRQGMTVADLRSSMERRFRGDFDDEDAKEMADSIVGGWIVPAKLARIADKAINSASGSDSSEYCANETAKRFLQCLAQGHIGRKAKDEE